MASEPSTSGTLDPLTPRLYPVQDAYDTELAAIEPHYRFYYDCLMRPNARSVLTALRCALPPSPLPVARLP